MGIQEMVGIRVISFLSLASLITAQRAVLAVNSGPKFDCGRGAKRPNIPEEYTCDGDNVDSHSAASVRMSKSLVTGLREWGGREEVQESPEIYP